jgi:hypothetical protein
MLANETFLAKSGAHIDENIEQLPAEMEQDIAVTKAQDALHKALLKFENVTAVKLSGIKPKTECSLE